VEQQWRKVFPKVVWLVQNEQRRARIVDVIHKLADDAQELFEVELLSTAARWLTAGPQGAAA
jgi:hypothetical protein